LESVELSAVYYHDQIYACHFEFDGVGFFGGLQLRNISNHFKVGAEAE